MKPIRKTVCLKFSVCNYPPNDVFHQVQLMNAIELNTMTHDGKVSVTLPTSCGSEWHDKPVRVIIMLEDNVEPKAKQPLLANLKQIKISAPADFSSHIDDYLNGIKVVQSV